MAKQMGFFVAAGHGLNYQNIFPVKKIMEIQEYNIGHSIVAHAVLVGFERAVREMKALVK
jgi:pyridoxine 5-phosphate synthase